MILQIKLAQDIKDPRGVTVTGITSKQAKFREDPNGVVMQYEGEAFERLIPWASLVEVRRQAAAGGTKKP